MVGKSPDGSVLHAIEATPASYMIRDNSIYYAQSNPDRSAEYQSLAVLLDEEKNAWKVDAKSRALGVLQRLFETAVEPDERAHLRQLVASSQ
jgi:hypothetical protein